MKNVYAAILFLFVITNVNGQKIHVWETTENIGGGRNPALMTTVYESSVETIQKELKSLFKDYDAKVSPADGGWFGDNARIKKMNSDSVDLFARWEKVKDGETNVTIAFQKDGNFISSSSKDYETAKKIVLDFATKTSSEGIHLLITTEQKNFDKLSNEQKKLEKENKNLHDDIDNYRQKIEDYQNKIKQAQNDIETNNTNQGRKKEELAAQQKVLDAAKEKESILK